MDPELLKHGDHYAFVWNRNPLYGEYRICGLDGRGLIPYRMGDMIAAHCCGCGETVAAADLEEEKSVLRTQAVLARNGFKRELWA